MQHAAEAVDVRRRGRAAADALFRRRVRRRKRPRCRAILRSRIEQLADTEIKQYRRAVLAHEYIRGFDITMQNQMLVRMLDSPADRREKTQAGGDIQIVFGTVDQQRCAVHVFDGQIRNMLGRFACIDQARDIRMIEFREQCALACQAFARGSRRHAADQFQRHTLRCIAEQPFGQQYRAHAARTQFRQYAIRADLHVRGRRQGGHCRHHGQCAVQKDGVIGATVEQAPDFDEQRCIVFVRTQECLAQLGQRSVEQSFDAIEARAVHDGVSASHAGKAARAPSTDSRHHRASEAEVRTRR